MAIYYSDLRLKSYTFDFAKDRLKEVYTSTIRGALEQDRRATQGRVPIYLEKANLFLCVELIEICVYTISAALCNFGVKFDTVKSNADVIIEFKNTMLNLSDFKTTSKDFSIEELTMYLHVLNNKRNSLMHGVYLTKVERNKLSSDIIYQISHYNKLRDLCNLVLKSYKTSFEYKAEYEKYNYTDKTKKNYSDKYACTQSNTHTLKTFS